MKLRDLTDENLRPLLVALFLTLVVVAIRLIGIAFAQDPMPLEGRKVQNCLAERSETAGASNPNPADDCAN